MAHIRKHRNGNYEVRYRDPLGKERSRRFARKAEANQFMAEISTTLGSTSWVDPNLGKRLFGEIALEWLESVTHMRPTSLVNTESRLRRHVLPEFGSAPIAAIRPEHVRQWISHLQQQGLAAATIKKVYWTFSKIMSICEIDGLIARSPCAGIDLPKEEASPEMTFLTPAEIRRLADSIDDRYRALIYAAAYTGCRWGELAGLRIKSLNLLRATIDIVESLAEANGRTYLGPTKTGSRRTVIIPKFLARMLDAQLATYRAKDGFVFSSAEGMSLRRNFYRRHFKPAVIRAGLNPKLRFHDLRHTCVALLIAQGAHPKEIQEHLGHSTIRLTFDRYGHLFPGLSERLRDGLQATFEGGHEEDPQEDNFLREKQKPEPKSNPFGEP